MDTKQKTRPAVERSRSRSAAQHKKSGAGRSTKTRPAKRPSEPADRRQSPRPSGQRTDRRSAEQPRRAPQRQEHPVRSDAPEQVFKPAAAPVRTRDPETAKRTAQRRRSAKRAKERMEQKKRAMNRPAVVYTQPKPINWNRLLLQIVAVLAVVLAVVMGLSVFFKVEQVVVFGNKAYSAWTIQEAAGIEGGENLMSFSRTKASGKIISSLPYVKTARIGIKLPDTVNIYIEEIDVAYAIQSTDGTWWLMTSSGNMVEQIDTGTAGGYTKVLGVKLENPAEGEAAKAVEEYVAMEAETTAGGEDETTEVSASTLITGYDRLKAALVVLSALEANDIVGEAASVDVTSISNIELWYGQQYQVKLGDVNDMEKKISWMKSAVAQRKEYDTGILDVSFTTWPDQVGYTPLN